MKTDEFLTLLRKNHSIILSAEGDELKVKAPNGALTPDLISEIRSRKSEIISFFNQTSLAATDTAIPKVAKSELYEMSSAQRRLHFLQEFDQNSVGYNVPLILSLNGDLDINRLNIAFQQLINKHESFRTSFEVVEGKAYQRIADNFPFDLEIAEVSPAECNNAVKNFSKPFDLSQSPLLRAKLLKKTEDEHVLLIDMHHIIIDGVSSDLMIRDLADFYEGKNTAESVVTYKDFAAWQNAKEQSAEYNQMREFWLSEFKETQEALELPTDFPRPAVKSFKGDIVNFRLGKSRIQKLRAFAEQENTTMFSLMLSVYTLLLSKLSNQEDLTIGVPSAGRENSALEGIIGMFVNTIAIRKQLNPNSSFVEFLQETKEHSLSCFDQQGFPYEDLVESLKLTREASRNPLFDVMFAFENFADGEMKLNGLTLKTIDPAHTVSKFDMMLVAKESEDDLILGLEYSVALFKRETITRFSAYLETLVDQILINPSASISELEIMPVYEKNQLVYEFNNANLPLSNTETLLDVFDKQARETPENIALVFEGNTYSYREVKALSNQVANFLVEKKNIRKGDLVGVMLERELDMIPVIYGIMKAGAAYVPIDPAYPVNRIEKITEEAGLKLLISRDKYLTTSFLIEVMDLSADWEDIKQESSENCSIQLSQQDMAYVIFTSGSTGKPKGVVIGHSSVYNIMNCLENRYPVLENNRYLFKTTFTFDVSVAEIFGWFHQGGSLAILKPGDESDPVKILDTISKNQVTHMNFVPSMFSVFLDGITDGNQHQLDSLEYVFLAGEALPKELVDRFTSLNLDIVLENIYGPTEGTIYSCGFSTADTDDRHLIPIGKPLDNIKLFVTGQHGQLQPIGVAGELCIGGAALSLGYLNNEQLTNEKFVEINHLTNERVYKTGDLVRWQPDGNIEYLGRIDNQIKVRGFRIELDEVAYHLGEFEGIQDTAVIAAGEKEDKYLVSYYVAKETLDTNLLREFMKSRLPDYMVPLYFMHLKSLPLNANGKLDRKALPKPRTISKEAYVAPVNETEEKLVSIWSGILKTEPAELSTQANFFVFGGHSIRALQTVSEINKVFQIQLSLQQFFLAPTIAELALVIQRAGQAEYKKLKTADSKDFYKATSAESRMYFLQQLDNTNTAYNIFSAYTVSGTLDFEKVNTTFKTLINRHSILRTRFQIVENELVQEIVGNPDFIVERFSVNVKEVDATIQKFVRPFEMGSAPLFRVGIIEVEQSFSVFMIEMHHIISDNVTIRTLKDEFIKLYTDQEISKEVYQYVDYSEWYNSDEQIQNRARQKDYWLDQLEGELTPLQLPYDFARPKIKTYEGGSIDFTFTEEEVKAFRAFTSRNGITAYMGVLSVFSIMLSRLSSGEEIIIGSPVEGRTHQDAEKILGMFVNTVALRVVPEGGKTVHDFINEVKQTTVEAFNNQECPMEEIIEALQLDRDMSRNPIFDVVLNMFSIEEETSQNSAISATELVFEKAPEALFDIVLTALDKGNKLEFNFSYSTRLFTEDTMVNFVSYFKTVLHDLLDESNVLLSDISLMNQEQENQLLVGFNDTAKPYEGHLLMHQLFERQVVLTPENIALESDGVTYTYEWLNQESNKLAYYLRENGIERESSVAVIMKRNAALIVSLFAILKAGGKYVPIEPYIPHNRKNSILESVEAVCVITNDQYLTEVNDLVGGNETVRQVLTLEYSDSSYSTLEITEFKGNESSVIDQSVYATENPFPLNDSNDLAYVIFTSGSSGQPKGVAVQHKPVINLIEWVNQTYQISENDKILMVSSVSFDLSVYDIFGGLATGASLRIANESDLQDPELLADIVIDEEITFWDSAPAMLTSVIPFLENRKEEALDKGKLRISFNSGDWIPLGLPGQMQALFNDYRFIGLGGATEATIWSNFFEVEEVPASWNSIPYGKPIQNAKYLVLDKHRNLCPVGVPGDLYIGGQCLAVGYLNDPELSNKKFIKSPFYEGEMLYDTGDMAQWFPDGNIEFMGRKDSQVKIRGYRIELGEIENKLMEYESVSWVLANVIEKSKYDKHICMYYLTDSPLDEEVLRAYLANELPAYMIPKYFVQLDKIPMTKNGKVNRKGLPQPQVFNEDIVTQQPETDTEKTIAKIWSDLLKHPLEKIGVTDDFFELGGQSILAVHLSNQLQQQYGAGFKLRTIFEHTTIKELTAFIEASNKEDFTEIARQADRAYYPVSPAQNRLYYEQTRTPETIAYNVSSIFNMHLKADAEKLQNTFDRLIERHEGLRTGFSMKDEGIVQTIHPSGSFKMERLFCELGDTIDNLYRSFIRPFDLSDHSLIRAALVTDTAGHAYLFVDIHHIVCDGLALNTLMNDFKRIYQGEVLDPLPIRYVDYATSVKEDGQLLEKQKNFWQGQFSEEVQLMTLPGNPSEDLTATGEAGGKELLINQGLYHNLKELARTNQVSDYMCLLSVYYILLSKITGQEDLMIATDGVGRTTKQFDEVVGTFINLLPLRIKADYEINFSNFLVEVKQIVLNALDHQDFQFDQILPMIETNDPSVENPMQVHFSFANYISNEQTGTEEKVFSPYELTDYFTTQYEFKIEVAETENAFKVMFIYDKELYEDDTIELLMNYFRNILKEVVSNQEVTLESIELEQDLSNA